VFCVPRRIRREAETLTVTLRAGDCEIRSGKSGDAVVAAGSEASGPAGVRPLPTRTFNVGPIPDDDPAVVEAIGETTRAFELETGPRKRRMLYAAAFLGFPNTDHSGRNGEDAAHVPELLFKDWSWAGWETDTLERPHPGCL
jgi:hypothetical protein